MTQTDAVPANTIRVKKSDLPLSCPRKGASASTLHPRVYIPLKKPGEIASCPYCRTRYQLEE
ncbi:MAG: zinc-finger domain-containing protein [Sedimenticola sp.]|nr:zinc-finger domain-containing protein [Sedimenticola sp.]